MVVMIGDDVHFIVTVGHMLRTVSYCDFDDDVDFFQWKYVFDCIVFAHCCCYCCCHLMMIG